MAGTGRKNAYKDEFNEQARKLCLLGATNKEMADFFGVSKSAVDNWIAKKPEFRDEVRAGKAMADANVAERLYQRAMGYEHSEDKIFLHEGKPVIVTTVKHYPPDTGAVCFWLKNRRPDLWRDQIDHKHGGEMKFTKIEHVIVDPKN